MVIAISRHGKVIEKSNNIFYHDFLRNYLIYAQQSFFFYIVV